MTGGGPANLTHTLATWMIKKTFTFVRYGSGTAIAWTMVFIMMIIIIPYTYFMSKE
jgi:raffinose/stachyose/melibiose transport system permease protein